MKEENVSKHGVQDVGLVTYVTEAHYRFLAEEAKKIDWSIGDVIRRIIENAIRDAKESD